jgi:acyl-CoA carboxylase subunit beta
VALVFGNSTAGGAYVPGMCDYAVLVAERARVFLGGPPLVKMATRA